MFIKDSRPDFVNNEVYNNDQVGIFVRDKSNGVIRKNIVLFFVFIIYIFIYLIN